MDPLGYAILAMSWIICTKPQVSLVVPIDGRLADCEALLGGSKACVAVSWLDGQKISKFFYLGCRKKKI